VHTRVAAAVLAATLLSLVAGCSGGGILGKQYEYEEDLTLDIDGSATLVVNASLPALAALRGLDVPEDPAARIDADRIRAMFETPVSNVTRVSRSWRRNGRRFIQVRIEVDDIRKLSAAAPFSWSQYQFGPEGGRHVYQQLVGPSAFKPGTLRKVGWTGSEIVAFRLHLPSRITFHNARDLNTNETSVASRGNILAWEQHLSDRLDGRPVEIRVEMESESILHRTLWLFAGAFGAAVLVLAGLIWWTMHKGKDQDEPVAS
jgi:hypothetical protein